MARSGNLRVRPASKGAQLRPFECFGSFVASDGMKSHREKFFYTTVLHLEFYFQGELLRFAQGCWATPRRRRKLMHLNSTFLGSRRGSASSSSLDKQYPSPASYYLQPRRVIPTHLILFNDYH